MSSVFGEEEDAEDVGDFGILAGGVRGFGGLEGFAGCGEVLLLEMEVGEGYVHFGKADFGKVVFGEWLRRGEG